MNEGITLHDTLKLMQGIELDLGEIEKSRLS